MEMRKKGDEKGWRRERIKMRRDGDEKGWKCGWR